jgi:hypothetical protein
MEDGVVAGAAPPTPGDAAEAGGGSAHDDAHGDEPDAAAPKRGAVPGTRSEGSSMGVPEQSILPREGAGAAGAAVGAVGVGLRTRDGRKREHPDEPSAQLGAQPSAQLGASPTGPAAGQPVASTGRSRKSRRKERRDERREERREERSGSVR